MIYNIVVMSWDMHILQELFSTGIHTGLLLSTHTIVFNLMNIIILYTYKTKTLQVIYYFNRILKLLFIIKTSSTLFHVDLILHLLHSVMQQFSYMKLSCLLLEIKLFLIYWTMRVLKFLMSLIQSQIDHPVINFQHRLR